MHSRPSGYHDHLPSRVLPTALRCEGLHIGKVHMHDRACETMGMHSSTAMDNGAANGFRWAVAGWTLSRPQQSAVPSSHRSTRWPAPCSYASPMTPSMRRPPCCHCCRSAHPQVAPPSQPICRVCSVHLQACLKSNSSSAILMLLTIQAMVVHMHATSVGSIDMLCLVS